MPLVATISPTQSQVLAAVRAFLLDVTPQLGDVVTAMGNRVPEPQSSTYAVMTPTRWQRISTNFDQANDVKYIGSIAGNLMTVPTLLHGTIVLGTLLYGVNVAAGTVIQEQLSGPPGGSGTYQISVAQTLASETLSSGYKQMVDNGRFDLQIDFHSADLSASDLAESVSIAFRDEYGVDFLQGQNAAVYPLHADDPRQVPFINDQNQYEWRWVLDACLQVDQTIAVGQQFMDSVQVTRIPADAFYTP